MKVIKMKVEEFKDKKLTKANKHLLGVTNSNKKDNILFNRFGTDADAYERGADELAARVVNTSDPSSKDDVIGFIDLTHYTKYDKKNNELVWYIPNSDMKSGNQIISYFKPKNGLEYYKKLLDNYYKAEIK